MLRALRLEGDRIVAVGREAAAPGAHAWVDCTPEADHLAWLGARFGFHHLALEDAASSGQRTKVEEYPGTLFLVLHRLVPGADGSLEDREIHVFLTAGTLVTVHREPVPEVDQVFARASADPDVLRRGPDFALYLLLDAVTDAHFAIADDLTDRVDLLGDEIDDEARDRTFNHRLSRLRRELTHLRRRLAPQRELLATLARPGLAVVHQRTLVYFRDVEDHLLRITEEIDVARELVAETAEIYLAAVSNRLNAVMARLALAATIFLPLTFVTGFFGMNLPGTAVASGWWVVAVAVGLLPPVMWTWFRRRGWF